MSKVTYVVTSSVLKALQKKAKTLKKQNNIPHHEALNKIAKSSSFANWEHLKASANKTSISENAFRNGLVWAMDLKDAEPSSMEGIVVDNQIQMIFMDHFVKQRGGVNEEDNDFLEELLDFHVFYRYEGETPQTFEQATEIVHKYFFFPANYIWLRGEWYDMFGKFDYDKYLEGDEDDDSF